MEITHKVVLLPRVWWVHGTDPLHTKARATFYPRQKGSDNSENIKQSRLHVRSFVIGQRALHLRVFDHQIVIRRKESARIFLRLWVGSARFSQDLSVSPWVMKKWSGDVCGYILLKTVCKYQVSLPRESARQNHFDLVWIDDFATFRNQSLAWVFVTFLFRDIRRSGRHTRVLNQIFQGESLLPGLATESRSRV